MAEITLEKEITKLEKFLKKEGRQDLIEELMGSGKETLDAKLLSLAKARQVILTECAEDEDLVAAKERVKELGATYREQLKMNDKISRFVSLLMKEKGLA